ncbi:hypothetical protein DPMN_070099 [Dreissena polymorpha]|uniref:RNA helicase n=1 Tax=Dreissena polymorpha TaxID=45954 RepID=A0A9D3Z0D0_DREPO|nr:hypothetical protein DPMN_070099 [Dreissena polymorpha]
MDKELTNEETRNWVKVCLAFRCVTDCFNQFLKTKSEEQYNDNITCLTIVLGVAEYKCSTCNLETIRNKLCPEKTCEKLYDLIVSEHVKNPKWSNSKSELWSNKLSGPWERMKCFIETSGYTEKSDVLQADVTAFVQICFNNVHLKRDFGDDLKYLDKIRSIRNDVSHLRSMKINTSSFKEYILDIKNALQLQHFDQYRLADQLQYLESLKNDNQRITVEDEIVAKEDTLVVVKDLIVSLKEQLEQTQSLNVANSEANFGHIKQEIAQLTVIEKKLSQQIGERFNELEKHLKELQKKYCKTTEMLSKHKAKLDSIEGTLKLHSTQSSQILMEVVEAKKILEKNAGNNEVLERLERKVDDILSKPQANIKQIDVPDMKLIIEINTSTGNEQAGELLVASTNGIGRDGFLSELQRHIQTALNNFCKGGVQIKYVKNECMAIYCGYPNMKCWLAFLRQYLKREFDEVFLPVQNHLRTYIGYEDLELKKSVQSIFYQLDAHLTDAVMFTETHQLDKTSLNKTGTGKTYVALNIIEKHLADTSKVKHRVVFMARTNVLIQQQFQTLTSRLPRCKIKLISSEMDAFTNMAAFLPNNDILCLTPQILLNNIDKGSVQLSDFSLLILDECHHTSGNLPYANLGRRYIVEKNKNVNNLPQIVGLTASIGIGKARTESEAVDYILKLCALLDCRILSTVQKYEDEYMKWCNIPTEERISLVETHLDPCREAISRAILKTEYLLEEIAIVQPNLVDLVSNNRPDHAKKPAEYIKWALLLQTHARHNHSSEEDLRDIGSCARYLAIFVSAFEVNKLLPIKHVIKYLAEAQKVESQGKDRHTENEKELYNIFIEVQRNLLQVSKRDEDNPNVSTLCAQLRQMLLEKGEDSRAMVFVQARATCKALAEVLDLEFKTVRINAHYLFGQDTRGCIPGMSKEDQTNTLEKFKDGHYKILVCTSVGIEGLDVPDCNIVINYNYAGNEITKVQMRGRSRKSDATHITIASSQLLQRDEVNIYKVNIMYRAMKQILQMDSTTFRRNLQDNQRHELKYHDPQHEEPKKRKLTCDDDFTVSCHRCNAVLCQASDIHKLENNQHFVVDQSFPGRVKLVEHTAQQRYAGILKRYKMHCKSCPLDWGIVAESGKYLLYIIKLENLKFKNNRTEAISFYRKWGEVPFDFPQHDLNDIPSLLAYQTNTE